MPHLLRYASFPKLAAPHPWLGCTIGNVPYLFSSVADPECLSRIPDPDFYPSRISDPKSRIQQQHEKRRGKNYFYPTIFCSHKYHKIVNNFIFEQAKKIVFAKTLKITVVFTQKYVIKLSKIWVWDPGPEIRDPEKKPIPDPGHRIPDPYPQHFFLRKDFEDYADLLEADEGEEEEYAHQGQRLAQAGRDQRCVFKLFLNPIKIRNF